MRHPIPVSVVLAILVLAAVTFGPAVAAQDEPSATLAHPIIGSWTVNEDVDEVMSFMPGGSVINVTPDGVAVGAWATTGAHAADIAIRFRPPEGMAGGYTIRGSLKVSEDGATFSGTYTFEPSPELAEVTGMEAGELGPGEVAGQRMTVAPMGEVVGPLPDFDEPPGGPEGSPVPGASPIVLEVPPPAGALPLPEASPTA